MGQGPHELLGFTVDEEQAQIRGIRGKKCFATILNFGITLRQSGNTSNESFSLKFVLDCLSTNLHYFFLKLVD